MFPILALAICLATTVAVTPVSLRVMRWRGVMDVPNARSSHSQPTPRGGGVGCMMAAGATVCVGLLTGQSGPWVIVGAAAVIGVVGLVDDRMDLSAWWRLGAQLATGALMGVLVGGGWWIAVGAVTAPVAVNVVNFMDGINGITCFTVTVWGGTALYLGYMLHLPALSVIGAIAAGTSVGFLPWNAPMAKMFLGDAGSYFLGALVCGGILRGWAAGVAPAPLLAPLSIYLVDVGVVLVRRLLRGAPLLRAHREHVYQRLVSEQGLAHGTVAGYVAILSIIVTVVWVVAGGPVAGVVTVVVAVGYLCSVPVSDWVRTRTTRGLTRGRGPS